jgi:hypothetical protein
MIVPAVSGRELRKRAAGVEKVGLDAGIFRPVRRADSGGLDHGKVGDSEAVPRGVEAARQLHEMVEIGAVALAAAHGAARSEEGVVVGCCRPRRRNSAA